MTSLIGQVDYALKGILAIGESRHQDKNKGTAADKIHSWRSLEAHRDRVIPMVKWCHEHYGIKELRELTPAMVTAYIADMIERGLSNKYIANTLGSLRKLETAMASQNWKPAPGLLTEGLHAPGPGEHRFGYSSDEAETIIEHLVATTKDVRHGQIVRLMHQAGLRVREAVQLRREDIDVAGRRVQVKGKGGRVRWAKCQDQELLSELHDTAAGRFVFDPTPRMIRNVQADINRVRKELNIKTQAAPCHGFRGLHAEESYEDLCANGQTDQQARQSVARQLGHKRARETYAYVPRR
ncbi:MAG: tyrosine-type recombinase/integrase [Chloroflexi bacterium]|nr:tyrosine-type recombinase/integrase [Chloroflexota bacterium]